MTSDKFHTLHKPWLYWA